MWRWLSAILVLSWLGLRPGLAGPNADGVLNAHDADLLMSATDGSLGLCAQGAVPSQCEAMDTYLDGAGYAEKVWKIYASFCPPSSPRVRAISWGVHYDPAALVIEHYGHCGTSEITTAGWPATDEGTTVYWDTTQTGYMLQVYWFAGETYGDPTLLELVPNPSGGGFFEDDSTPPIHDLVLGYGSLGFDMGGGVPACPSCPPVLGACCDLCTALCTVTTHEECINGDWISGLPSCTPNPCSGNLGWGACCSPDGTCRMEDCPFCLPPDAWLGNDTWCEPNPCPQPLGACCDRCNGACQTTTQEACVGPDLHWMGDITCSPNPCPTPLGACCTPTGECILVPCSTYCPPPNLWHPGWYGCTPNPCANSSVSGEPAGLKLSVRSVPNPNAGEATIRYSVPAASVVRLEILDASGRRVRGLLDGTVSAGVHDIVWDGSDGAGAPLPAGVYRVRIQTAAGAANGSIIRIR